MAPFPTVGGEKPELFLPAVSGLGPAGGGGQGQQGWTGIPLPAPAPARLLPLPPLWLSPGPAQPGCLCSSLSSGECSSGSGRVVGKGEAERDCLEQDGGRGDFHLL